MRLLLLISVLAFVSSGVSPGETPRFRSDLLAEMARALHCEEQLDTLSDGFHPALFSFNGTPVSVIKRQGIVEHIGFRCFTEEEQSALGEVPCRFLERYTLSIRLPLQREKSIVAQMDEDGVIFEQGGLDDLVCSGTSPSRSYRAELIAGRRYIFIWSREGGQRGKVVFPADYELLSGRGMRENERRLPGEITAAATAASPEVVRPDEAASRPDGILVRDDGEYLIPSLRCAGYYTRNGEPLFGMAYPAESVANLLGGMVAGEQVDILFKMRKYPLENEYFHGTVDRLVAYGRENGFVSYFGMTGLDGDSVEGIQLMRNTALGCVHLLRVRVPLSVLETGKGSIQCRLTPFIPVHSVRYLFEESAR